MVVPKMVTIVVNKCGNSEHYFDPTNGPFVHSKSRLMMDKYHPSTETKSAIFVFGPTFTFTFEKTAMEGKQLWAPLDLHKIPIDDLCGAKASRTKPVEWAKPAVIVMTLNKNCLASLTHFEGNLSQLLLLS